MAGLSPIFNRILECIMKFNLSRSLPGRVFPDRVCYETWHVSLVVFYFSFAKRTSGAGLTSVN